MIQNNGEHGFRVWDGSHLRIAGATIQNNIGSGVSADIGSTLQVFTTTISDNGGDGITLRASTVRTRFGTTITNNAGNGIFVGNLSFLHLRGPRNVSGNASTHPTPLDVNCASVTAATSEVTSPAGVGNTNCVEPAP